uniref:Uncharacterized protein n=1 Tax=Ixodes scapularis TaxID=6945 RepID=A0A1S4LWW7_IXOSC
MTFAYSQFRYSTRLLRWGGVWIVAEATNPGKQSFKTTLKRPYFWYCVLCLSTLVGTEFGNIIWALLFSFKHRKVFVSGVYTATQITVLVKTMLSSLMVALAAGRLKKLVARANQFEIIRNIKIAPRSKKVTWRDIRIWGRVLFMVLFVSIRNMDNLSILDVENIFGLGALVVVMTASSMLLVIYDCLYSTVFKSLVEIFIEYLRYEIRVLKKMKMELNSGPSMKMVEDCRIEFNTIQGFVKSTNQVMRYAFVMAYAGNLIMLCNIVYLLVDTAATPWALRIFSSTYGILMWIDMIDNGVVAEGIKASKMKWLLQSMPFQGLPDSFAKQVRFLHDIVDDSAMYFTGAGFFRINLPQLVSMGSTIITYTVILIQTSQGLQA